MLFGHLFTFTSYFDTESVFIFLNKDQFAKRTTRVSWISISQGMEILHFQKAMPPVPERIH